MAVDIVKRRRALQRMRILEEDLLALTEPLAAEIAKPFPQRNAEAIHRGWDAVEAQRREYARLVSTIGSEEKPDKGRLKPKGYREAQEIYQIARDSARRLRDWAGIGDMVLYHADPPKVPLIDWAKMRRPDPLVRMIDTTFHRLANRHAQAEEAVATGFADIPMAADLFDMLVNAAYRLLLVQGRAKRARFVDVGCGGGTRAYIASRHFRRCDGVEFDAGYVAAARSFMDATPEAEMHVHHADALTFEHYADYDVIYFYRPIKVPELLGQLERKIVSDARPGTIILAPFDREFNFRDEIDCARTEGPVFVAGVTQAEADALHEAACHTDTRTVPEAADFVYDPGFWRPLVDASSYAISST